MSHVARTRRIALALAASALLSGTALGICPSAGGRLRPAGPGGSLPSVPRYVTPGTPSVPRPVTTPGGGGGTRPRSPETLDERAWEAWWVATGEALLPPVRDPLLPSGDYAPGRAPDAERGVDALIACLRDADGEVRTAACRALAVLAPPYRVADQDAALRRALSDAEREVREVAVLALARRGAKDLSDRFRALLEGNDAHEVTKGFAAIALVLLDDEEGIDAAERLAKGGGEPEVAAAFYLALGESGRRERFPLLAGAAERATGPAMRARRTRGAALCALGKLGERAAIPLLARALDDRERSVARAAAVALGGFRDDEVACSLLRRRGLTSDESLVRAFAALSLGRVGRPEALPALASLARADDSAGVRAFALLGLGLLGGPAGAVPVTEVLSQRRQDGVFAAAAVAAGMLRATGAEAHVASALGGDPWAEGYACLGLGLMRATTRVDDLRRRLWADDATIQAGAVTGLGYIDATATAAWLLPMLRAATGDARRAALAQAVGLVGSSAEARELAALATNASASAATRARAIAGIARVLTGRAPSWAARLCSNCDYATPNVVLAHLAALP